MKEFWGWLSGILCSKKPAVPASVPPLKIRPRPVKIKPKAHILTASVMTRARARGRYRNWCWAGKLVGTPWDLMGSVNYRETGMRHKVRTGGWCQVDLGGKNPAEKAAMRKRMTAAIMLRYGVKEYGPLRSDHRTGAIVCAHILKQKGARALRKNSGVWNDEVRAEALFGYNGRASYYNEQWQMGSGSAKRHWRWSPYVANFMDGIQLFVQGREYKNGKRISVSKRKDQNHGALLVSRELRMRRGEL